MGSLKSKAQRENKFRDGDAGSTFSAAELAEVKAKNAAFVKKRPLEEAPEERLQKAPRRQAIPRMAALSWIRDFDHACLMGTGHSLARWFPKPKDVEEPYSPEDANVGVLSVVMDQMQTQWCAANFMTNFLGMSAHFLLGPMHRRHNDVDRGLSKSGYYSVCLRRLFEMNCAYGPWGNGQVFQQLREQALDIVASMDSEDKLVLMLWPRICEDFGWTRPEQTDSTARKAYLKHFDALACVQFKGARASTSRWCSMLQAMQKNDQLFHSKLLLLSSICLRKGWVSHFEDLLLPGPRLAAACGKDVGEVPKGPGSIVDVAADGSSGAAGSKDPAPPPAPAGKAKAKPAAANKAAKKKDFRAEVGCVIKQSVNMLHACCRLMANPDTIIHSRWVIHAVRPLLAEHGSCAAGMRTPDETLQYYMCEAQGKWLGSLNGILMSLTDKAGLQRCGLTVEFPVALRGALTLDSPRVKYEDAVATEIWKICSHLMAERIESCTIYTCTYPYKLAPIASEDPKVAYKYMKDLKEEFEAWLRARASGLPSVVALSEMHSLSGRAMQEFCRFARSVDWMVTPAVQERVKLLFKGFGSDKLVEDANKVVRDNEQRSASQKCLKGFRIWHAPVSQGVLASYGRTEVVERSLPVKWSAYPKDQFQTSKAKYTSEPDFARILGKQTWYSPDAHGRSRDALIGELIKTMHTTNDWSLVNECWRSALVPRHHVVLSRQVPGRISVFYVMYSCIYGVTCWPCVTRGARYMLLDWGQTELQVRVFTTTDGLEVIPVKCASPLHGFLMDDLEIPQLGVMLLPAEPIDLMKFHALNGFPGINESVLKKVCEERALVVPDDHDMKNEDCLAMIASAAICPDMEPHHLAHALFTRGRLHDETNEDEPWDFISSDDVQEVLTSSDKKVVKERRLQVEVTKANRSHQKSAITDGICKHYKLKELKGPAAYTCKKVTTKAATERWWSSIGGDADFLERHKPSIAHVFCDNWNGRFRVTYPGVKPKSVSWTLRGVHSASMECLVFLWAMHKHLTGEDPPIPLDVLA